MSDAARVPAAEATVVPPAPTRRQRLVDWARRGLIVLVVGAAVVALVNERGTIAATVDDIAPWQLVATLVVTVVGIYLGMLSWRAVVVGIAHPGPGRRLGQVYLVGQLGKYLPGSVWAVVLQMEIGRKNNLPRPQVLVAALVSTGISVAASLVVGLLAIPQLAPTHPWMRWLYLALPILLLSMHPRVVTWAVDLVLRLVRRPRLESPITARSIVVSFLFAVAMYCVYGIHLWLLVRSRGGIGLENAAFLTGALALGMTVGVLAFLLPSGLGAREAVLVAALATVMPSGVALAFAVVSRAMFTVAELLTMAVSLAPEVPTMLRHRRQQRAAAAASGA
ncbi:lysylphosphatidylglycerol synthase domain-containing protein [Cellulomonas sp. PS-H5]|uniref:lysylphosphatidylglycerol synthase domain-containing protein n=1 Tax=Cellulomonas sp. PS-H5 TaxID=2820400 RepID=UPI001C4F8249|nr:lysylphosphatidylglycerol synthase domain-containing protein [Cellulomonas sp. PS-H5]MBW0254632.1 flippase-like domain-containing protein [Cellulomonas sp. PS-H5]